MEEKKVTKISLSTFFLVLAIMIIIVMGIFMYEIYNKNKIESERTVELEAQINTLNEELSNSQGKINDVSNTVNTDTIAQTSESSLIPDNKTTINSSTEEKQTSTQIKDDTTTYSISVRNEIYAIISATKDGKTISREFEQGGMICKTGTINIPNIGTVALVSDSGR